MRFTSGRLAGTRAARHVLLAAGSAALAAGVVAGTAGLAAASVHGPGHGHRPGHGHGPGTGSGQPSTAPAFFAGIISQSTTPPSQGPGRHRHKSRHHTGTAPTFVDVVQTFSSANGAPAGTLTFPSGQNVDSLARLGSDQSFVAASFDRSACVSHLWKFTIDSAGKPGSLTPLSLPQVSGQVEALAGSADGSTVAFTAEPCKGGDQQVVVLRQATGTVHRHQAGGVTRWDASKPTGSLSLTADGSVLGFVVFQSDDQGNSLSRAWTLSTTSHGGPLLRRAHQVPGPAGNTDQAVLSPSGDQIWTEAGNGQGPATLILATTSTGAQVRQVTQLSDGGGRLALDNSGQHMLAYGGNPGPGRADVAQIDLSSGQTSTLTITDPVIDGSLTTFAW